MSRYCRVCNYCYVSGASDTCERCQSDYNVANEPKRMCPVDGAVMAKLQKENIVIDVCGKCNGVWVDGPERDMLKEQIQREGRQQAYTNGMIIGMIVG